MTSTSHAGTKIVSITAGAEHSMAVSDSGQLYTWGNGTRGCLGDPFLRSAIIGPYSFCFTLEGVLLPLHAFTISPISAQRGNAGHGVSAAGYHEDEHAPRLVRSLAGRYISFAAAGLANSGHLPKCHLQALTGAVLILSVA